MDLLFRRIRQGGLESDKSLPDPESEEYGGHYLPIHLPDSQCPRAYQFNEVSEKC